MCARAILRRKTLVIAFCIKALLVAVLTVAVLRIASDQGVPEYPPIRSCNNSQRQHHLQFMCTHYPDNTTPQDRAAFRSLFVDDEHKVLYCSIPKAACTSLKHTLIRHSSAYKKIHRNISIMDVHEPPVMEKLLGLKRLRSYSPQEIELRLRTYFKYVVVRHPFVRLFSTYMDKFQRTHFDEKVEKRIIKKFRVTQKSDADLSRPSFEEFISFLSQKQPYINEHWDKYVNLCHPCFIKYDYIGRVETFEQDHSVLIAHLEKTSQSPSKSDIDKDGPLHFNMAQVPTSETAVSKAYQQLPQALIQRLYEKYEMDFKLFGYDYKENNAICNISQTLGGCC